MPAHAYAASATVSSDDRWPRIRAVVAEVAGAATFDRARRFASAWDEDPDLRAEVADFLATSGQDDELLYQFPTEWLCAAATIDATVEAPRSTWYAWRPGSVIGPYVIEQLVGEGGMGQVFAAYDERLGRAVALKRVLPAKADRADASTRSLVEARAIATLDHENIVPVYDVLEHDGRVVIVMKYVEGQSLKRHVARGPVEVSRALRIAHALAGAAHYAHEHGIVHCDIKPGNVHLTAADVPKLLDFGIARLLGGGTSRHPGAPLASAVGGRFGTPGYMAPEQLTGRAVDPRTDVYALGVVLYEMLSGERPFGRSDPMVASLMMLEGEAPDLCVLNPAVPWPVRTLVAKAMAKDPGARFQSAAALQHEITAVMEATGFARRKLSRHAAYVLSLAHAAVAGVVVPVLLGLWVEARTVTLQAFSPTAQTVYDQGVRALQEGAYFDATRALEQAVALDPACPLGWARLAEARQALDDSEGAKEAIGKVTSLVPDRTGLEHEKRLEIEAILGMANGTHPEALAALVGLTAAQPDPPIARLLDLGRAYEANDDLTKAIETYRKVLARDQDSAVAHLRLGVLYARRDDAARQDIKQAARSFDVAERLYERAGRVEGQALVSYERGSMYERLHRPKEARPPLEIALRLATSVDHAYLRTATLFKLSSVSGLEGRYDEAQRSAEAAIVAGEGTNALIADGLVDYGWVLVRREDHPAAAREFDRALKLANRARARRAIARARHAIGNLLIHRGDVPRGIEHIEQAIKFYERGGYRRILVGARISLVEGLLQTGALARAESEYRKQLAAAEAQGEASGVARLLDLLCSVLLRSERYTEALAHCDRSIAIYRGLGLAYDTSYASLKRAEILLRIGRRAEAGDELRALSTSRGGAKELPADLRRQIALRRANVALGEDDLSQALALARPALSDAPTARPDMQAQLHAVIALALARSADVAPALQHADKAVELAKRSKSVVLVDRLELVRLEALLRAGRERDVWARTQFLATTFAGRAQLESEWRAHLIAGAAAERLRDPANAERQRAQAESSLNRFQRVLSNTDYEAFVGRADVRRIRREYGD